MILCFENVYSTVLLYVCSHSWRKQERLEGGEHTAKDPSLNLTFAANFAFMHTVIDGSKRKKAGVITL